MHTCQATRGRRFRGGAWFLLLAVGCCHFILITTSAAQSPPPAVRGGCPSNVNFETAGYRIRAVRVHNPFGFLRSVQSATTAALAAVSPLESRPFRYEDVAKARAEIEDRLILPEQQGPRVRVSVAITAIENCDDHELDVVYTVFSSQISPLLSSTYESRQTEKGRPQAVAGSEDVRGQWQALPAAGYNASEHLFAGGRLAYHRREGPTAQLPLDSVTLEGRGSNSMHDLSAAFAGSKDSTTGRLGHAEWLLSYLNSSEPTGQGDIKQARLGAQFSMITQPVQGKLPLRFGGMIEGGSLQSGFAPSGLPSNTLSSAGYGSLKFYGGVTSRLDHNVLSASYGIEIGSTGAGAHVDWLKHIVDIAHDVSWPVGDHRPLEFESRLTGGVIQVLGTIPLAARFFGGNREDLFVPGDSWQIRSSPVIRSIPANRFFQTGQGPGGTSFIAYNLTAAYAVWRKPIVPTELSADPEFARQMDGELKTATNFLQPDYAAKDPHFVAMVARLPELRSELALLKASVSAAKQVSGDALKTEFKSCESAINMADRRAESATESKGGAKYGLVAALLPVDEDRLNRVHAACGVQLNSHLSNPAIAGQSAALDSIRADMERNFQQIDQALATQKAEADMRYVKRTLNVFLHELNLFSVSPVAVFDVARIGPSGPQIGTRYAAGGGLRFTLVSNVDFTVGYAANPIRRSGEGPGALFFSMHFKDVLQ